MAIRSETSRKAVLDADLELLGDEPPARLLAEALDRGHRPPGGRQQDDDLPLVAEQGRPGHRARSSTTTSPRRRSRRRPRDRGPRAHLDSLTKVYAGPEGRLVAQLIAECQFDRATLRHVQGEVLARPHGCGHRSHQASAGRGRSATTSQPHEVAELLYSPIYFRLLFQTGELMSTRPGATSRRPSVASRSAEMGTSTCTTV